MGIIKKQYYGIKFPFTSVNLNGFFVDLNTDFKDKAASEIAHVLLTQKRNRIRHPDFGTNIIRYIFEPNDELSWDAVVSEAKVSVGKYVPNASLEEIQVMTMEDEPEKIFLDIRYSVKKGIVVENNRMVIKL